MADSATDKPRATRPAPAPRCPICDGWMEQIDVFGPEGKTMVTECANAERHVGVDQQNHQ